ncbi:hypothetical protein Sango_2105400 [Sesamum angolense]|uniref:Uncharacterized protein n=1 Tax=Sesamum angolense TaxID=2727404 RepID=A0AAE1WC14_9LAMI|nr:hypothetical protein Sango_2105400 [Sesamum angolense]
MLEKLLELGQPLSMLWLILGDFNCVKSPAKKQLGVAPTYNPIWCKFDPVLLNNEWLEVILHYGAHFSPRGCLSSHSLGIDSIFDHLTPKTKSFRFSTMWANHPNFIVIVEDGWSLNVESTPQFNLCRKLKALKSSIKAFNSLHFSHISVRAKKVDIALQDAQLQLESNPGNAAL